jgi:hypothetical protein
LGNPKSFHYLNQSNCYELVGVSDAHDYLATRRAMDIVGISEKEQVHPFQRNDLTALLHRDKKDYLLTSLSLSLSLRKQFSELLLQYFILAILFLRKERKLIHRFQKMTNPNSILK